MNKFIKYGVVAGLTMAAFSLATTPATYASTVEPIACDGAVVAADGDTANIALADTTCTIKVNFNTAFFKAATIMGKYNTAKATFTGASVSNNPGTTYYAISGEDKEVTLTLNANALNAIRSALKSGNTVSVTVANSTNDETIEAEAYKIYFTAETVQPVLSVAINGAEATTVANSGATVDLREDTTTVVLNAQFPTAFGTGIAGNQPSLSGFKTEIGVSKYKITKSGNVATFTLTAAGIQEVLNSESGVTLTVKDTADDVVFTVTLKKKTTVDLESVEATIDAGGKIDTIYNEGYEGEPTLKYDAEEDFADIVTVAADGTISVAETYKTATDKEVTITVTATDGEIVKTTTVTYTIKANYTAVEAGFGGGKDTIKVSGNTTIVIDKVDGAEYEYSYEKDYLDIDDNGKVTVKADAAYFEADKEFVITVKAVDNEAVKAKELKLTVEKNYTWEENKPTFTVLDGAEIEAGKPVVIRIDADKDALLGVQVINKALYEKLMSGEELTDEEQEAVFYSVEDGKDYTVTAGSTVIALSDAFIAKLPAGEYLLQAYFYDDSNIDNIKGGYAESVFSIAAAPDTGAYTASTSATSSVLASVLAAVTAAGAAVVAKFAKRK